MDWQSLIKGFKHYLKLERSMSDHSIQAYCRDANKLASFAELKLGGKGPLELSLEDLESYIQWLFEFQFDERSQARMISGIKAFYKFLLLEDVITYDPTELLEGPKLGQYIPDVLGIEEIELILQHIDLSDSKGHRDRAIIETLYACGLRVSELTELLMSHVYPELGIVKVIGKGNKERLVPIGEQALQQIHFYKIGFRNRLPIAKGHEDYLFLNRFGKKLSRISVFTRVKECVAKAGIQKIVSPHTFRHSFATHLVEGGANLRAVQEMLGHESINTTEIYTHLDNDYLRETILNFHPANRKHEQVDHATYGSVSMN
ncbi:MAG: tyrosine recombinase XerD [Saprospiraceae bacterium]|nr:tyrosine recombinase XerD [Candidatus Defluviibacterium haderslevense]